VNQPTVADAMLPSSASPRETPTSALAGLSDEFSTSRW